MLRNRPTIYPNVDDSLLLVWNIEIRIFCTACPGCLLAVTKQLHSFGVKIAGLSALACGLLTSIKQILIIVSSQHATDCMSARYTC